MKILYFSAIDADGVLHHGRRQASDRQTLASELEEQGMTLLRSRVSVLAQFARASRQARHRFDPARLSLLSFQLAHLLQAGVPLLDAFDELIALENKPARREVLVQIRERIDKGSNLSDALRAAEPVFGARYLAMVQAGEASGELARCLMMLEASLRQDVDTRARLHSLMIYPALAVLLVSATAVFLFVSVIPQLVSTLDAHDAAWPVTTRVVVGLSSLVSAHGYPLATVLSLLLMLLWAAYIMHVPVRHLVHRLSLSAGLPATLYIELAVSRYSECVALLYANGVALIEALEIAEPLLGNIALRGELADVRHRIVGGSNVGEALATARWLPGTIKRLVAAGESAGVLDVALLQAGEQLRMSARHGVERIEHLLPGVVLAAVGGLLLMLVVAVILPVYDTLMAAATAW